MLGHLISGSGPQRIIVLNDWLCDTSTWDAARPYLDLARFTWAFADLRGYGRSRGQRGDYTVEEASADVLELADALGWPRFAIVGHSMSSLIALHLAQHAGDRVERAVLIAPPPPKGMGADDATLEFLRASANEGEASRAATLHKLGGGRLSRTWAAFKAARWVATSDPEAVAAYAELFARHGLPDPYARVNLPLLAVTGEQDAPVMRRASAVALLSPLADDFTALSIADSGHYPMQEAPPLLVAIVERFLSDHQLARARAAAKPT